LTETYTILKTFLIFITKSRFGGVGALEDLEIVPEIHTDFFCKINKSQCFWLKVLESYWIFSKTRSTL
jgi:hypothetical protein